MRFHLLPCSEMIFLNYFQLVEQEYYLNIKTQTNELLEVNYFDSEIKTIKREKLRYI